MDSHTHLCVCGGHLRWRYRDLLSGTPVVRDVLLSVSGGGRCQHEDSGAKRTTTNGPRRCNLQRRTYGQHQDTHHTVLLAVINMGVSLVSVIHHLTGHLCYLLEGKCKRTKSLQFYTSFIQVTDHPVRLTSIHYNL